MPWLLYRSMLAELLRLAVLTTAVLVTVIAFGAAIKPLAREVLLTAGQTAKYILLAIVPMLQFALPFAAGFAGTMSLHRMTSENEIVATATSGISYRRLLVPIAGLGVALMLVMIVLTQWIIPRFWGLLERAVAQDITSVFQAAIERGEPFAFGDWQVYADEIFVDEDPEGTKADTRLILFRVAVAVLDDDGRVDEDVTAHRAVVDIYRRRGETDLSLAMDQVVGYKPQTGVLASLGTVPITRTIPSALQDDPRRMTRGQLLALRRDPDAFGPVIRARSNLAEAVRDVELWQAVDARMRETGRVELIGRGPRSRQYVVYADRLQVGQFISHHGRPVEVVQFDGERAEHRFVASVGLLRRHEAGALETARSVHPPSASADLEELTFDLTLTDCQWTDLEAPEAPNYRRRVPLESLAFEGVDSEDLSPLGSEELLARAARVAQGVDGELGEKVGKLQQEIRVLQLEITGRLLKRYALSVTAMLLLTLGATLAMWLRESLPLVIYLWAFLPAVIDLILISSGEHVLRNGDIAMGVVVMWSGNFTLLALLAVAYQRLVRH